jgi:hypothetical protein
MKVRVSHYPAAALAIMTLLFLSSSVSACLCPRVSPCEAYADSGAVFVGLVTTTKIETVKGRFPPNAISTTTTGGQGPVASFRVEEAFLGVKTKVVEVSGGGTNCDYYFEEGKRYLVYASRSPDGHVLYTNACSGTKSLSEAQDDLRYLRSAARRVAGGTISGVVNRKSKTVGEAAPIFKPIPKAKVFLEAGTRRFNTITDEKGSFEFRGIPGGRYKIHTYPATNHSSAKALAEQPMSEWEIVVPRQGCLDTWFVLKPDGEISGTVIDDTGVVPKDVEVQLVSADEKPMPDNVDGVMLDDARGFEFSFLPPGRYILGFNLIGGPSLGSPYPEFFYPGVSERARATVIEIGEHQKVNELYLPRPLRLGERVIEGVAVLPDGRPLVSNCSIQLINPRTGYREGNCVSSDRQGRFSIKAIEGQTYELSATISNGRSLVDSKPMLIKVGATNEPVRLLVEKR